MGAAYIETTITAEEGGVVLFETDCVAQVEYELADNDVYDWSITDFRFDKTACRHNPKTALFEYVKTGEVWCPDDFRAICLRFADYDAIEQRLIDKLTEAGELTLSGNDHRADYHARVR